MIKVRRYVEQIDTQPNKINRYTNAADILRSSRKLVQSEDRDV